MSKTEFAASEQQEFAMSANLTNIGRAHKDLRSALEARFLPALEAGTNSFFHIEELAKLTLEHSSDQRRVAHLAEIIILLASENGIRLDAEQESFRDDLLPRLEAFGCKG